MAEESRELPANSIGPKSPDFSGGAILEGFATGAVALFVLSVASAPHHPLTSIPITFFSTVAGLIWFVRVCIKIHAGSRESERGEHWLRTALPLMTPLVAVVVAAICAADLPISARLLFAEGELTAEAEKALKVGDNRRGLSRTVGTYRINGMWPSDQPPPNGAKLDRIEGGRVEDSVVFEFGEEDHFGLLYVPRGIPSGEHLNICHVRGPWWTYQGPYAFF